MNVGVLGFAHGHVNAYCRRWREAPDMGVSVTAGWDHDAERAKGAAERYGVTLFETPEALLASDVEGVVIAAETSMHADLVEKTAAAEKGIVLQKPIALTMEEADRIVVAVEKAAVEGAGVPFTMAWQMRADPENLKIRELVQSGRLGRIFMVRRRHGLTTHRWEGFEDWWHNDPELNRDIFADDAAHAADFVYWLLGMPASVTAELGTLLNPKVPNDNAIAVFRYGDGTFAEVVCSFVCVTHENTTEIMAERGTIIQNYGDGPSSSARPQGRGGLRWFIEDTGQWEEGPDPGFRGQGDRIANLAAPLAEFLKGEREALATAREGRDVLRMILACYESNESGKRVAL
ncbi:MAG: Gfo/Idh/MocA family protein [Planctomycetota bacterium]|jgi:predicted dehydrogenase